MSRFTMTSQMPPAATPERQTKAQVLQARILDLVKARINWDKMRPAFVTVYSETCWDEEIDGCWLSISRAPDAPCLKRCRCSFQRQMALAQAMGDLLPEIQRIPRLEKLSKSSWSRRDLAGRPAGSGGSL
jgi:hypothetical protein